jgi:hypothetical protein
MTNDPGATADHVLANRVSWDTYADEWVERGRVQWASDEACWGVWQVPESELRLLPQVGGRDTIELGCGTGYVSAWLARRGGRSDLAISEYGAALWCDPYRWIPEAARILRVGGELVFLSRSYLASLTSPDEDVRASEQLQRDHFGMHRFDWPDAEGAVEFGITHGDMISLLRRSGSRSKTWSRCERPRTPRHPPTRWRRPRGPGGGPSRKHGRPAGPADRCVAELDGSYGTLAVLSMTLMSVPPGRGKTHSEPSPFKS